MRSVFASLLLLGLLWTAAGCSHYQLGTGAEPRFSTLHISVVKSDVILPQAVALVTAQLRESFIKDGRVRLLDSPADAQAVLEITLDDYTRGVTVSRADDTGLARRFDVTLHAHATLTDNRTRQPIFSRQPLSATRGVFTDSGQIQSEYQALPLIAAQLADKALHAALDNW